MVGNESRASRVYVDGSPEDVVPIMTTTDVKLLYAECEIHLGNNAKASKYISEVDNVNGISGTSVSVEGIKQLRKSLKLQDYFAFLKRNGLAIKELGLEKYQLLLPIPQNEINLQIRLKAQVNGMDRNSAFDSTRERYRQEKAHSFPSPAYSPSL